MPDVLERSYFSMLADDDTVIKTKRNEHSLIGETIFKLISCNKKP